MKAVSRFALSILTAELLAGSPVAVFAADPPPTQPAAPESKLVIDTPADARVREGISAIANAPDPSAVVEAYAGAAEKDSVPLKQAYVKRLVALGVPELAETQARDLARRRPGDGLAWAVVGFMDARRNNTPAALKDVVDAARHAPDDPFVERTAAQVIAYYDVHPDQVRIEGAVRDSVTEVQRSLSGKSIFARAYQQARLAYAQAAARLTPPAAAPAAAPTEPYSELPAEAYPGSQATVYNNTSNTYAAAETDPFVYDAYTPYPWWPSAWWWDPGIVIVDGPFFRDRDRFHHDFDDRDRGFEGRADHGFDDRRGLDQEGRARSSDDGRFRGSPGMTRSMPPLRSTPPPRFFRPSAPFQSSQGFSGGGGGAERSGGHMAGGAGGGHAGGGHR